MLLLCCVEVSFYWTKDLKSNRSLFALEPKDTGGKLKVSCYWKFQACRNCISGWFRLLLALLRCENFSLHELLPIGSSNVVMGVGRLNVDLSQSILSMLDHRWFQAGPIRLLDLCFWCFCLVLGTRYDSNKTGWCMLSIGASFGIGCQSITA